MLLLLAEAVDRAEINVITSVKTLLVEADPCPVGQQLWKLRGGATRVHSQKVMSVTVSHHLNDTAFLSERERISTGMGTDPLV